MPDRTSVSVQERYPDRDPVYETLWAITETEAAAMSLLETLASAREQLRSSVERDRIFLPLGGGSST